MHDVPDNRRLTPRRRAAALVGLLAAAVLAGPTCRQRDELATQQPLTHEGVPQIRVLLTAGGVREVTISTTGAYELLADERVVSHARSSMPSTRISRRRAGWWVNDRPVTGRTIILNGRGGFLRLGATRYRGQFRIVPFGADALGVINVVNVETYLAGVLAKELYPSWSLEAYRAQAVAARSFALFHRATFGRSHAYDLGDSQASQVYGGADAETPTAWKAVRSTHGQILAYGEPGAERAFLVQYSSCCGGVVNPAEALRPANDIEPLAGQQRCADCRPCPHYRWPPVRVAKDDLYEALAATYPTVRRLGGLARIRVKSKTRTGRYLWLDLVGPRGRKVPIRAEDVRLALLRSGVPMEGMLRSMTCTIRDRGSVIEFVDGRGYGHGVGLCQWGAEGKAARGWAGEQILQFYYPGAVLVRTY